MQIYSFIQKFALFRQRDVYTAKTLVLNLTPLVLQRGPHQVGVNSNTNRC